MMDDGFDAKELLLKHLLAKKEIGGPQEFIRTARKQFFIDDRGELTKRGNILATVVQSDPTLISPH